MKLRVGRSIKAGQLIVLSKAGNAVPVRPFDNRSPIGIAVRYLVRGHFAWTLNGDPGKWTNISDLTQISVSYHQPEFISEKVFPNERTD